MFGRKRERGEERAVEQPIGEAAVPRRAAAEPARAAIQPQRREASPPPPSLPLRSTVENTREVREEFGIYSIHASQKHPRTDHDE